MDILGDWILNEIVPFYVMNERLLFLSLGHETQGQTGCVYMRHYIAMSYYAVAPHYYDNIALLGTNPDGDATAL